VLIKPFLSKTAFLYFFEKKKETPCKERKNLDPLKSHPAIWIGRWSSLTAVFLFYLHFKDFYCFFNTPYKVKAALFFCAKFERGFSD
jgi:hypothetical protein